MRGHNSELVRENALGLISSAFPTTSSARPSGGAAPGRVLPVFNVVAQAAGVVAFVGGAAAVLL